MIKTKILFVDDEQDLESLFNQLFRRKIQTGQYEFIYIHDGKKALNLIEQQPDIDVVLSDINMPGIDGLTLLSKISEVNPIIRTVMVTAYGDMNNIRTAMNRGAFDFITKPINFKDLEITVEKAVQYVHQLREMSELKAVDEMKTRFFTNITHELRTPLTLIISPVDKLLETGDLSAPFQKQLSTIRRNARQLLRLINQLLDINKLEARQMNLVNEVGDLPAFVEQIVDLFRPSTDIKQLELIFETDMPSGNYLFDADKWEKILYNLLSNSIKFTETGAIVIRLTQTQTTASLAVSDTGIGVPADKLSHIFNRFYQVDYPHNTLYQGSGIGLALVHELVLRLGGNINVTSQVAGEAAQQGTHFLLELPVQRVADQNQETVYPTTFIDLPRLTNESFGMNHSVTSDNMPLILVVEDKAEMREFIVAELATTYRIRSAANGYEGWMLAQEELPDIIISDLMMPRMDGYTLIEHIKTDQATNHIAIILLTGSLEHGNRLKGYEYGADDYLTKPFNLSELRLKVRNLLSRQQKLREHYQRQLTQPDAPVPVETKQDLFLSRLYQLVEQRLDDSSLSVEWLADQMAMSRKTFYRKVHTLVQLSPNELIRQYRLRKAIDLLRAGNNASETAYLLGFESPSHFSKVFREFYQRTPTDYLKK
ncbi:response regulator [Dyadobacter sp. NIV53]|uniref:response regulator n=1 Tax=Dyadobacter sp. NIV53 TaxID=2861765 RepID=UPI001E64773B|nr:response regulator [Dyadobacter sp. NIV53]